MVAVRPTALVSDEERIRGVYARGAIQIDTFTFFPRSDRDSSRGHDIISQAAPIQIITEIH